MQLGGYSRAHLWWNQDVFTRRRPRKYCKQKSKDYEHSVDEVLYPVDGLRPRISLPLDPMVSPPSFGLYAPRSESALMTQQEAITAVYRSLRRSRVSRLHLVANLWLSWDCWASRPANLKSGKAATMTSVWMDAMNAWDAEVQAPRP